jgi:hypothetical protein
MEILTIEELLEPLGLTDLRAVRAWCDKNDVLIIKQAKIEFVVEAEFTLAYELPFINKLKRKFGDNWEQVYNLYKEGNVPALNTLSQSTTTPQLFVSSNEKDCHFTQKIKEYENRKKNAA